MFLILVATAVSFTLAYSHARRGRQALGSGADLLAAQDVDGARRKIDEADQAFTASRRHLDAPWARPFSAVPLLDRNIDAVAAMTDAGSAFVRGGRHAADAVEHLGGTVIDDGKFDLDRVELAGKPARRTLASAVAAEDLIAQTASGWLLPPIAGARKDALARAHELIENTRQVVTALDAVPRLLGEKRPKRYFVAIANLAELRGTGGLLGHFTVIDVDDGRVKRTTFRGRPQDDIPLPESVDPPAPEWFKAAYLPYRPFATWGNLNLTSDFPTIGRIITDVLPKDLGEVDGVVQLDPVALASILKLTGPITVASWPQPLTSDNISAITHNEAYIRLGHDARISFLGDVVDAVFEAVLKGDLRMKRNVMRDLVAAAVGGHIQAYATDARDQRVLRMLGLSREVRRASDATDVLGVVTNNSSGNKLDWYLRRRITYDVQLDPRTRTALADLEVELSNSAPAKGLPAYIIKSPDRSVSPGENRAILVTLRAPSDTLLSSALDSRPVRAVRHREDALGGYHLIGRIPSRETLRMSMQSVVHRALTGTGRHRTYRLRVLRQPTATPDRYEIEVVVPKGWRALGPTSFQGAMRSDLSIEVEVVHTWRAWLMERAVLGPLRLALELWRLVVVTLVLMTYLLMRRFDPFNRRGHTRKRS